MTTSPFRLLLSLGFLVVASVQFGCGTNERCDRPHAGGAFGGVFSTVSIQDGADLASLEACGADGSCADGTTCQVAYLESCFTESLCMANPSTLFECPAGSALRVIEEQAPGQIVCARTGE